MPGAHDWQRLVVGDRKCDAPSRLSIDLLLLAQNPLPVTIDNARGETQFLSDLRLCHTFRLELPDGLEVFNFLRFSTRTLNQRSIRELLC
ncbi:hypothetical protein ABMA08_25745 [Pseudomonas yamanorum]